MGLEDIRKICFICCKRYNRIYNEVFYGQLRQNRIHNIIIPDSPNSERNSPQNPKEINCNGETSLE
jgi:hypothetical protein